MSVRSGASSFGSLPDAGIGGGIGDDRVSADTGLATFVMMAIMAGSSLVMLGGNDLSHRTMLCVGIGMIVLTSLIFAPVVGVVLAVTFGALLGGVKRWIIPVWGYEANDPLMIVLPAVALLMFSQQLFRRKLPTDTPLARLALALLVIMSLQVLNPQQGGLMIGLAGALFYIIPFLWYWVGRSVGSVTMLRALTTLVLVIGFFAGLYGLKQVFFGLFECEKQWIRDTGWVLGVGAGIKVFSTFCSSAEFSQFVGMAMAIGFVRALRRQIVPLLISVACFVILFFTGNRGPIFASITVCTVIWAVLGKSPRAWIPRLAVALVLGLVTLEVGVHNISSKEVGNAAARDLVQHQVEGLSDPLGRNSTGGLHAQLIGRGFASAFIHPLGKGLGATNLSGTRVGDVTPKATASATADTVDAVENTEFDISNLGVSCGLAGFLVYGAIVFLVFRSVLRLWMRTRDTLLLECLAILVYSLGVWLMGGHYSGVIVVWLIVGTLDRLEGDYIKKARVSRETTSLWHRHLHSRRARSGGPAGSPALAYVAPTVAGDSVTAAESRTDSFGRPRSGG